MKLLQKKMAIASGAFNHEAAHILLHSGGKGGIFLGNTEFRSKNRQEQEANKWAGDIFVPEEHRFDLLGLRGRDEFLEFLRRINVHLGIVVDKLQHEQQLSQKSV